MKRLLQLLLLVFFILIFISYQLTPYIEDIANYQIKRFCQLVVNGTASSYDASSILVKDGDTISVDMAKASSIASGIVYDMEEVFFLIEDGNYEKIDTVYQERLKEINDQKGVIASIPVGSIFQNSLFQNSGPNINVRYVTMTYLTSEVKKEVEAYGINHTMVQISLVVTIHIKVATLFYQEEVIKEVEYPLVLEIMQGDVPQWYQN